MASGACFSDVFHGRVFPQVCLPKLIQGSWDALVLTLAKLIQGSWNALVLTLVKLLQPQCCSCCSPARS